MDNAIILALLAPFLLFFAFAVGLLINLLLAWPLMEAWNYVVPSLFSLHPLTYWQAFALLIVASLLVKSSSTSTSK